MQYIKEKTAGTNFLSFCLIFGIFDRAYFRCWDGGIGRRDSLRGCWLNRLWGFKSPSQHQFFYKGIGY